MAQLKDIYDLSETMASLMQQTAHLSNEQLHQRVGQYIVESVESLVHLSNQQQGE